MNMRDAIFLAEALTSGRTVYHVTLKRNLNSILAKGLIPKVGPRSRKLKEQPSVFCFPSIEAFEDAGWLLDEFPEDAALSLLKIDLPEDAVTRSTVAYEIQVLTPIPPEAISVLQQEI